MLNRFLALLVLLAGFSALPAEGQTKLYSNGNGKIYASASNGTRPLSSGWLVWRQITERASFPVATRAITTSGDPNPELQSWFTMPLGCATDKVHVKWWNYEVPALNMVDGNQAFTIRAGVRNSTTNYQITKTDASIDEYVPPGEVTEFGITRFGTEIAKNTALSIQYRVIFDAAESSVYAGEQNNAVHNNEYGSGLTDRTMSDSWSASDPSLQVLMPPNLVLGLVPRTQCPAFGIIGDSIYAVGTSDAFGFGDYGGLQRALRSLNYSYVNSGGGGLPLLYYFHGDAGYQAAKAKTFNAMLPHITHMVVGLGTNDIDQSQTDTQICNNLVSLQQELDAYGITMIPLTVTPRTNAANTTYFTGEGETEWANRRNLNDKIRNLQCGNRFYIDMAEVTQDETNINLWKSGYTSDGIHMNANSATPMRDRFITDFPAILAADGWN